jgi:hypothetical protein
VTQENNNEDPVMLLLRKIRGQLDQLADEITTMLDDEHLRDNSNQASLARYDKETDGKQR